MISIIVCSKHFEAISIHKKHIADTIGVAYEYIVIDNTDRVMGICAAYNKGVELAKGDVLVFLHEDLFFITNGWGEIFQSKLTSDNDIGLIGVAGTKYLFENNPSWVAAGRPYILGKVVHKLAKNNKNLLTVFSDSNIDEEAVAVDGLCFAIKKSLFKSIQFDEKTFDSFHFYDLDICMQIGKLKKILVTSDILVKHLSGGSYDEKWKMYGIRFIEKYKNQLPASVIQQIPDINRRIPFDTFPLDKLVKPDTFKYIQQLGIEWEKAVIL